ncbi:unnamed protein product [Penicillium glandicola]
MILPGRSLITRSIIRNVKYPTLQAQPCGVDLTLKRILKWTSPGIIDLDNKLRQSGVMIHAGVMDSGYEGAVGALMQVINPTGLRLYPAARLAQFVFHQMSEKVEGYNGVYQGMTDLQ